jgi:hypothetical protein
MPSILWADDIKFFDNGELALFAKNLSGIVEPAVPIYFNGGASPIGDHNHQLVEAFDNVPGTGSFPSTFVDIHANTFFRQTYQRTDGSSGSFGTSIVGAPSFRRSDFTFEFLPTVTRGDVFADGEHYRSGVVGNYGSDATMSSTRRFFEPITGQTIVELDIHFDVVNPIALAMGSPFDANDRTRFLTSSTMFANSSQFDANLIRYEDINGMVQMISLADGTPRGQHLLSTADEIGGWFELIKGPGSTWFPDSPTIRVDILERDGLRLGFQGFLDSSTNPNDDSLSLWLEWLDSPDTLPVSDYDLSFRITAVPEPSSLLLVGVAAGGLAWLRLRLFRK